MNERHGLFCVPYYRPASPRSPGVGARHFAPPWAWPGRPAVGLSSSLLISPARRSPAAPSLAQHGPGTAHPALSSAAFCEPLPCPRGHGGGDEEAFPGASLAHPRAVAPARRARRGTTRPGLLRTQAGSTGKGTAAAVPGRRAGHYARSLHQPVSAAPSRPKRPLEQGRNKVGDHLP